MNKEILTDEMIARIIAGVKLGDSELHSDDILKIVRWSNQVAQDASLLGLAMEGQILIGLNSDGDLKFRVPSEEEQDTLQRTFAIISINMDSDGQLRENDLS